jgi:hypothetical protein
MNDLEITRIAAAIHELRPDWPAASLRTLIAKHMANKPRRDVMVALSWVACESGTSTPGRVLEAGPWWKAAGIESGTAVQEPFDRNHACGTCGLSEAACRQRWEGDHEYLSVAETRAKRVRAEERAADDTEETP